MDTPTNTVPITYNILVDDNSYANNVFGERLTYNTNNDSTLFTGEGIFNVLTGQDVILRNSSNGAIH